MNPLFMVDLETTGVNLKTDEILQIAILELRKVRGFWEPGRLYERCLGTSRQPADPFAREHMAELYAKCNQIAAVPVDFVRKEILAFFRECGVEKLAMMTGQNASGFDLPFLVEGGYLQPSRYEGKEQVGDFHYRVYEMGGAIAFAQDVLGVSDKKALEKAAEALYPEIELPKDRKSHDAVFDCYRQTRTLNGLIRLCGGPRGT
jgi:DNA polymerase III, epsilon subunit and related 3''-5'' exonucleases